MVVGEPLQEDLNRTLQSRRLQYRCQRQRSCRPKRLPRTHPPDSALQGRCGKPERRGERSDTGEARVLGIFFIESYVSSPDYLWN